MKMFRSSNVITVLLVVSACVTSTTLGYDGSMMNGLNILPSYSEYFDLNTTTLALNTSSFWIGGMLSAFFFAPLADHLGRKNALYIATVLTAIAALIQAASQNIAMFICARILIGLGTGGSGIVAPVYLAETLPLRWRAWGLGILTDFYYIGGLVSAGITYGTGQLDSTWAWRIPSAFQGLFSIICLIILPFVPESPRWLVYHDRCDEALAILALTTADGDQNNEDVKAQHKEIMDALTYEKANKAMSLSKMFATPSNRKRMFLVLQVACYVILSGNNIVSYYLGTMLTQAGITDSAVQLQINIVLNAWCLVVSIFGTWIADCIGRRPLALCSTSLMVIFLFLVGGFTKLYGDGDNLSGAYATTAMIFLFQGAYSLGWTPLNLLYPPEVLHYSMRANGLSLFAFSWNGLGLFTTFVFPFALDAIGYKTYMINASWDILELGLIYVTWPETMGKTLEELDSMFGGETVYLDGVEKVLDSKEDENENSGNTFRKNGRGDTLVTSSP